jgi:hypothetical protein
MHKVHKNEGQDGAGRAAPPGPGRGGFQPTIASATASATRMPSMAADMMPPA